MPVFIKDNKKILFMHIPKAGGSSIEAAFMAAGFIMHFHDHGPKKKNSINPFFKCSPQHMHAFQVEQIFDLNSFDEIFTVVRHPVNRFLSEFAMRNANLIKVSNKDLEFFFEGAMKSYCKNPFHYDNHIRLQSEFLVPGIKVFKLEEGLSKVAEYFKVKHDIDLEIKKKLSSKVTPVGDSHILPIDSNLLEKLEKFYEKDFVEFNYHNSNSLNAEKKLSNFVKKIVDIPSITSLGENENYYDFLPSEFEINRKESANIFDALIETIVSNEDLNCRLIRNTFSVLFNESPDENLPKFLHSFFILKNRNIEIYNKIKSCFEKKWQFRESMKDAEVLFYISTFDGLLGDLSDKALKSLLERKESFLAPIFKDGNNLNQSYLMQNLSKSVIVECLKKQPDLSIIQGILKSKGASFKKNVGELLLKDTKLNYEDSLAFLKKQKVALCVSGQLRGYKKAYKSWVDAGLIQDNTEVFVNVWQDIGSRKATPGHCDRIFSGDFVKLYKNLCTGREYKRVLEAFPDLNKRINQSSNISYQQLNSIYKTKHIQIINESELTIEFKNNHERMYFMIEKSFDMLNKSKEFDLVIRIRPDKVIHSLHSINWLKIKGLIDKGVVFTDLENVPKINPVVGVVVGDQFGISSYNRMKFYSETYSTYKNAGKVMRGHNSLAHNLLSKGVEVYPFPDNVMGDLLPPEKLDDTLIASLIKDYDKKIYTDNEQVLIENFIKSKSLG